MSGVDGYDNIITGALRGSVTIPRLSKAVQVITAAPATAALTLPANPILFRPYNIRVRATVASVQLFAARSSTDAVASVNGTAAAVGITLPALSTYVARCVQKDVLGGNAWEVVQSKNPSVIQLPAANLTLDSNYDGALIYLEAAAARVVTLPSPFVPGRYRFSKAVLGAAAVTIRSPTAGSISGNVLNIATATPSILTTAASVDVIVAATALAGSWFEVVSNGTGAYYISGSILTAGGAGLTFA